MIALGLHCYHRLSHCVASHSGGFSYEAQALGMRAPVVAAHGLWNAGSLVVLSGLVALRPMESSQTRGWTHIYPLHWEADSYTLHHQGSLLLSCWWIFWLVQGRLSLGHGNAVKETVRLIQRIPRETSITVLITIDTCTGTVLKWSNHWFTVCNSCIKHNAIAEYFRLLSIYHIQVFELKKVGR